MGITAAHIAKGEPSKSGRSAAARAGKSSFFSKNEAQGSFFPNVQAKLNVGQPGDRYEVEADAMADRVVQRLGQTETGEPFFQHYEGNTALQPQAEVEEETVQNKEFDLQRTPMETVHSTLPEIWTKTDKGNKGSNPWSSASKVNTPGPGLPILQKVENPEEELQTKEENALGEVSLFRKEAATDEVSAKQEATGGLTPSTETQINSSKGSGRPMGQPVQNQMGASFGADFSNVRIHTGTQAVQMSQGLHAQAFTYGNNIYFNQGKYSPETQTGQHLLAHELTHTVQQGAVVRQKRQLSSSPVQVQRLFDFDLSYFNDYARHIPGWTLFTVLMGANPLTGETVERNAINVIEGLFGLVPYGTYLFDKLQEYQIITEAYNWTMEQLGVLGLTSEGINRLFRQAWNEMDIVRLDPFDFNLGVLVRKFGGLYDQVRSFALRVGAKVLTMIKEALISVAEPILEENRAWSLIKKLIHYDPLRNETVEATTVEILEDFLILIGRETELEQMRERGTLQETADWLGTQVATFVHLLGELRGLITDAWNLIQPENLPTIAENFQALKTRASVFLQDVWTFAVTVATEVLRLIKNALLSWLNSFAKDIPGFTLLTVIIAKNPLTDEVVPRSAENIIRGFMGLIPGGEAKFQELKESGVIPRAVSQIDALIAELGFTWENIKQLFTDIWASFSIDDLIEPLVAFERVVGQFGVPIARLISFVVNVVKVLVNLILEIMGIPPDMVANIVANISQAFEDIKNDPIGFLLNLMRAIKEGFVGFLNNLGTHLMNGFQTWLFGTLSDAGIQMPPDLSFRSILGLAMDILGITVDNILDRLALKIGEERVAKIRSILDTLSGIWTFVKDVVERGPIAIWEYIQGQISNLWNTIKDGIMGYIQEKVIQQSITWLLSFLDVTGIMPVIRGVQSVFNAISSFVEKLREILGIVNSFVAGVVEIAKGNVRSAATFLENALADGIPIAISFLAKQLGLGNISDKIQMMIEIAREKINEGIDWLIDKAMAAGTAFLGMLGLGGGAEEESGPDERTSQEKEQDVNEAAREGSQILDREGISSEEVVGELPALKTKYRLMKIDLKQNPSNQKYYIDVEINPKKKTDEEELECLEPGVSAANIGEVSKHGQQGSSLRDGEKVLWLESEHILPFATGRSLWQALALYLPERGWREDSQQTTIMIYYGAARKKTPQDNRVSAYFTGAVNQLNVREKFNRAQIQYEAGDEDALSSGREILLSILVPLQRAKSDAVNRTKNAIILEHDRTEEGYGNKNGVRRGEQSPKPTPAQVEEAANRQYDDILRLVTEEVISKDELRNRLEDSGFRVF